MTTAQNHTQEIHDPELSELLQAASEAPTVDDFGKKEASKLSTTTKLGLGAIGGAVLLVGASYFMSSAQKTGPAVSQERSQMEGSAAPDSKPGDTVTDPEAVAAAKLAAEQEKMRAEGKSEGAFLHQDPFGTSGTAGNAPPPPTVPSTPPPPPVAVVSEPVDLSKDPYFLVAQRIADQGRETVHVATFTEVLSSMAIAAGVSTGNSEVQNANSGAAQPLPLRPATIGAGDVSLSVLTTQVSSLVPQQPVRAVIVGGPADGAVVLGQLEPTDGDYLVLRFTSLTKNRITFPIQAVAVDAKTQSVGLADKVDRRTFERVATMSAIRFAQAIGQSVMQEGTATSQTMGPDGSMNTMSSTGTRTPQQRLLIGLAGGAEPVGKAVEEAAARMRPEITINQNKELGILFTQPFYAN